MRVEVVPYDPSWPEEFAIIAADLRDLLVDVEILSIEHVGSTSVPGLAAKPTIDVDIVVATEDRIDATTRAMAAGGYEPRGDLGIPGRYAFTAPAHGHQRNIYVVVDGCLSLRNHLSVRDTLRDDPDLRSRYGDHKLRLATNEYDSIDGYVADKIPILQEILTAAGLTDDERDEIAGVNRPRDEATG